MFRKAPFNFRITKDGCMIRKWPTDKAENYTLNPNSLLRSKNICLPHLAQKFQILFSTVMTSPGSAFQECTWSCHENGPAQKAVSSNLWSTDRMTVLDRIEIVPILVHYRSVNVESKFESFHLNQKMNEKFLPCFLKLEQKFLVQMKTFKFSFDIYWPLSTILQQFTHNETQWPTDARQCCFALWDVSCRQSWHISTPSQ